VPSGTYYIRVRARNSAGVSAASNELVLSVIGTRGCAGLPGAPINLAASLSGSTVTLTWNAPLSGCAPLSYIVEAGSGTGLSNLPSLNTGTATTSFTANNVSSGQYYIRVRAATGGGAGDPSNEIVVNVGSSADRSFLSFTSQPGDYIGGGRSETHTLSDGIFSASVNSWDNSVQIGVHASDYKYWWYLEMAAPNRGPLTPGTYDGATRYPFQLISTPGLDFSGSGRGCNRSTGRFTVTEAVYGREFVQRFRATFEQHCEGGSPALFGEVRILADPWR